ncbi:T9SS-dependent choice-of-anchor J family protein [Marixanthomonas spongiae]|uniref:P/Homo B domain-containing protein n=1 Tax=Marixanthomonas spongiae TaxID=2174845 RepID=A0A2U0I606_9FLAO|nr:choice-of-anchor J domain-containing protein [Marixanthomonas spongiae]PVW16535.1 hypothetical protein DDV96_04615 [Marixanthomonas spongiae]
MRKITLLFFVFCGIVATMEAQFTQPNASIYGARSAGAEIRQQPTASIEELLARLHSGENKAGIDNQQFTPNEKQVLQAYLRGQNVGNKAPQATLLEEGFDDITTLPGVGYSFVNASDAIGATDWFQGNETVFPSQTGAPTAYIGANFNNTAGSVINNFMITPVLNLENGDEIKFWTRTTTGSTFPDRLEVRLDPTGADTDPTGPADVGSYTELLLEINPTLVTGVYPDVWTEFTVTVSGLTGATDTRVAFRYWVTDAGPAGNNSDYIGIDTLSIEEAGGGGGGVSTVYAKDGTAICTGGDFGSFPLDGPYNLNTVNNDPAANFAGDFDGSGTLYTMDNDNLTLLTIDPATGISTTVGPLTNIVAGHGTRGLAWNEANSTMYLLSGLGDDVTLYTVDLSSGTLTEIGTTTIAGFIGIWLAIDNDGNAYMADIGLDNLYSMDLATGTATEIGPLGIDISFAQDADFDPDTGILYMGAYIGGGVNQWASVDTATGAATGLGPVNADCAELTIVAIEGGGTVPPPPNCTSTTYDSTAVPFDIDGADTSTTDCTNAPNEIPITVTDNGTIGDGATLENITIDIAHTFSSDLDISLISPAGTELIIAQDLGGSTEDAYNGTMFEDGGADISGATAPFGVGPYMAVGGAFADAFDGESISGDWILKVCDDASGDTGTVLQFSMSICVPPTNDECENAYALSCGDTYIGETVSDTDSGGNAAPDEFFSYTGSGDTEIVTVSLCGSGTDFDTVLKVYDSCDLTTIVAENDDSCGLQSEVTFVSDGISEYLIMVEGFGSNSGNFELTITCEAPIENDFCDGALPIECGETITGSTVGATPDTDAPVCNGTDITAPGLWYTFTDDSGLVTDYTVSLCGSDYDTKVSVFSGDCNALVCEAGNDDSCGLQSEATFQGDGNSTYYILVHGFASNAGDFTLNVDCLPVPPPNDDIANSIDVDEIGFPYTDPAVAMPAATTEGGNPNNCNIDGANGVWYNFVSNGDGTATATVDSPAGVTVVTFFEAPDENATETDLTLVDQGTNQCLPSTSTTINTTAGQAYYVFVVNTEGTTDITIDGTNLGTEENTIEGFSYHPNPADDVLSLNAMDNIENVAIYTILGQKVIDRPIDNVTADLDISSLSTGTYLMKVSVNGEIGTFKLIKR